MDDDWTGFLACVVSVAMESRAFQLCHSGLNFHPPLTHPIEHSLAYILRNVCLLLGG